MTGIIASLGPSVFDKSMLEKIYEMGVRILRFNFPHFNKTSAVQYLELISQINQQSDDPFLLMLDTQGPSVRLGSFEGEMSFDKGDTFRLCIDEGIVTLEDRDLFCDYPYLVEDSHVGDIIEIDGGLLESEVVAKGDKYLLMRANRSASIIQKRHMNFPSLKLRLPAISDKDRDDLIFAAEHGFHFVALSFVSSEEDILQVRKILDDNGGASVKIVSKVENAAAIEDIEDIVEYSDMVMVARGDLGVEKPYWEVPKLQRKIVSLCKNRKKPVIIATEMLESMINRPLPTRAEVNDIYTAVEMGADFVMLSGETTVGEYPLACIEVMNNVISAY